MTLCRMDDCTRPATKRGLCDRCYDKGRRSGTLDEIALPSQHAYYTKNSLESITKVCSVCREEKLKDQFAKNSSSSDGLNCLCKTCSAKQNKEYKTDRKAKAKVDSSIIPHGQGGYSNYGCRCEVCYDANYLWNKAHRESRLELISAYKLARGCTDCHYNQYACALEFDHIDGDKLFDVSNRLTMSLESVFNEIAKCEVVCSNCHKIRTAKRAGWTLHRNEVQYEEEMEMWI